MPARAAGAPYPRRMKTLACERCGLRVFFENVACERCGAALGFVPGEREMGAFEIGADGAWQRLRDGAAAQKPCHNYTSVQACNWMVPADSDATLCTSCQTTHILPALSEPDNLVSWQLIEQAKRRLVYSLLSLGLPVRSKAVDPEHGVWFEFLQELQPGQRVLTGHDNGIITLNVGEADDARRERARTEMHEPYRTLLGHFRHEIGHYYWDLLVDGTPWLDEFRALFGDERADYAQALQAHYATPRTDWPEQFVSAYASAHPWEDWAECWAHYLHVQDGLETASAWGLQLASPGGEPVRAVALAPRDGALEAALIERWLPISQFINAMSRSLGSHDAYPFVVPEPVVRKLAFVHRVVTAARSAGSAAPASLNDTPAATAASPGEPAP